MVTGSGRATATVLFTDLVGSTEIAERLGEDAAETFRRHHFGVLRSAVVRHRGREVKNLGDGLMVVFESAVDGVAAAVAIQQAVQADDHGAGEGGCHVRVGVHVGEPTREGDDYFGTPVIVAKRLCDAAGPDQILVSEAVVGLVGSRGGFRFHSLGPLLLKGLMEGVATAAVAWWPEEEDGRRPLVSTSARRLVRRPATMAPPPDAFVGRETELAMLAKFLGSARLVTLTGPGGIGKTRLSAQFVDAVAVRYSDGVWCCPLASVRSDEEVASTIASALLVERRAGIALEERIVEFLAPKRALLVLDNCEQVVDGAGELCTAILRGASRVDVLATSREALGVAGEQRMQLEPLAVTDPKGGLGPAVTLFAERAGAVRPGFRLDDDTRRWAEAICRGVDGFPLAIELAAARVATRSVSDIAADIGERLDQLSAGRGRPERHRSMHAVVDWSYDLLDDDARRFFEELAVFAGGWRVDAASAVAARWEPGTVLDHLDRLVEQSLVTTTPEAQATRYAMLEPVRAYAGRRLSQRKDHDEIRDRHAGFFVSLAEDANRGMRGDDEAEWRDRLDGDLANLRAAHRWLLEQGHARQALRLVGALNFYGHIGGVSEVYGWAEEAAERFSGMEHPELAIAWSEAATGACIRGDLTRAQAFCELSKAAAGDDPVADLRHTYVAAILRLFGGDFEDAARLFRRAADLGALVGDDYYRLYAYGNCAMALAYAGRTDEACAVADEAMELATRRGNASMRAAAYYYAGEIRLENEPARAAELLEQSLMEAAAARNRHRLGVAGLSAISLQARTGDPHAALARYPDLIEHWQRAGAWSYQWVTIRTLIETMTRAGYTEPAAVLHGALSASSTATPVIGADAVRLATVLQTLRRELGDDALVHHQSRGADLGDAGALTYALETLRTMTPEDQAW